ncbi:type VI secretion system tube protein TssD [Providencia vermicola]|uniref:Type VI secretion system tube protein Hcp n=2 Tax=Providencia TaxID=586 RepID=A0AAI9HWL6_PROST|nr:MULTISPECIES: type VI secretion system tube protein TssD [Providencia]ELR5033873.1 type VI secretion system tube protein Hcp [Providencia stuartii]ELX8378004.1 type VI secretion system tube protein Hcp [Providencia stuartii]EMD5259556.1 type VI secretion system tube protein Hcp [Providencia stuartii]USB35984.1 type VI secretion system tube protein Hcp [Providencia vermicola]WFC05184.1 type VI secretion system tube protein TssD [Providencia vermicola]
MSDIIYLTLKGHKQGMISAGCSSYDSIGNRYQSEHTDEILVYSTDYEVARSQNLSHGAFIFIKADDKASALLLTAISNNEILDCEFKYHRIDKSGGLLHYKTIKLTKSSITRIKNIHPNSLTENEAYPLETVYLNYESITVNHLSASASGYSIKNNI